MPSSAVFRETVLIFSEYFLLHILRTKYEISYPKSLAVFLIFSQFRRRSNKASGSASILQRNITEQFFNDVMGKFEDKETRRRFELL